MTDQGMDSPANNAEALFNKGIDAKENNDFAEAVKCWSEAAEQGHAVAQFFLGVCYDSGIAVTEDSEKAFDLYAKSAEQGYPGAQTQLGLFYATGRGVAQDYNMAVEWWHKAAEQGDPDAQFNMGLCYEDGNGVTQDSEKAEEWYTKAAELGHEKAKQKLAGTVKFDIILELDNRAIQTILRNVDSGDLVRALKGEDAVQERVFQNMSKMAGTMLKDDIKYMGQISEDDIKEAQEKILNIIRRLNEVGDIEIKPQGGAQ